MALIKCKSCGKEVSDRAKACPACGTVLIEEVNEEKKPLICQECGAEIPAGAEACPNCGCPVDSEGEENKEAVPQKVEVTSVNLPKIDQKKKKKLLVAAAAIALVVLGIVFGVKAQKEKAANEAIASFKKDMNLASAMMLYDAINAEDAGNLIKSVWYNAIYEERDSSTDKYTRPNGYFVSDFNTALSNLFSDSDFSSKVNDIKNDQALVADYMKKLKNPPEGYEDAYGAVKDCYDAYVSLTNMVTNPSGSLQTYSSNFNDADTAFANKYEALKLFLD